MVRAFINEDNNWTIWSAAKTASSSLQSLFENKNYTIVSSMLGKNERIQLNVLPPFITLKNYAIIRDPISWYVSGYRYSKLMHAKWKYSRPNSFTEHLREVKSYHPLHKLEVNMGLPNGLWVHHCVFNPFFVYNIVRDTIKKELEFIKIEYLASFIKELVDLKLPKINFTKDTIPFPKLSLEDIDILHFLYNTWDYKNFYNFENMLNTYKEKHNET